MTRNEWKQAHREARTLRREGAWPSVRIAHAGRPFRIVAQRPGPAIVRACRIEDRPDAQLIARELADAAEDRRDWIRAPHLRHTRRRAHRIAIQTARAWRTDWRAEIRDAARLMEASA